MGNTGEIIGFAFVSTILVGLGFYTINFLAGVMTIFAAVGTVAGEIETGTFQAIVPKPLARWELIVGKFLGFAAMFVAYILIMAAAFSSPRALSPTTRPANIVPAIGLVMLVSLILLAADDPRQHGDADDGERRCRLHALRRRDAGRACWKRLGSIFSIQALINIGVVTSLILPSDVIWRRASGLLQPDSNLRFDAPIPIAVSQPPSNAMIVYAVAYIVVLVGGAVLAFRRKDL